MPMGVAVTDCAAQGLLSLEFGFTAYATNVYLKPSPSGLSLLDSAGTKWCGQYHSV
jgi:hypothetical protein